MSTDAKLGIAPLHCKYCKVGRLQQHWIHKHEVGAWFEYMKCSYCNWKQFTGLSQSDELPSPLDGTIVQRLF